jgi:hypothetical protein
MEKATLTRLSPPWYTYHRKVQALFGGDPQVMVKDLAEVQGGYEYMILVNNTEKASAIKTLLKNPVSIGSVNVHAAILGPDENDIKETDVIDLELCEKAFSGNPIFKETVIRSYAMYEFGYCVFKKQVVQFWNDDLSDYYGNYSGLAADIAKEILNPCEGVMYCTAAE